MEEYHKIVTVWKRDPSTNHKTLIEGEWALPEFAFLRHNDWVFTEKVDGTNIRVIPCGNDVRFAGKTDRAQLYPGLLSALRDLFRPHTKAIAEMFGGTRACLYGEGYGAKIQKGGGNYRQDQGFVLFDVRVDDWWLERPDVEDVAQKLGLDVVPIVGSGTLESMVGKVRVGFSSVWGDFPAEGIVARPSVGLRDRAGHRIITKLKQKDFIRTP